MSELCYRSISADIAEDKKHIDLCTEPLILVCAAGLHGSNADDVAKEVAIFRAHKGVPIVVTDVGDERFTRAVEVIHVPPVHPELGFVLAAMAGHLFGYEAALAIDASRRIPCAARRGARRSRKPRAEPTILLAAFGAAARDPRLAPSSTRCATGSTTATSRPRRRCSSLRCSGTRLGIVPLDLYQVEHGKIGTPAVVVDDLTAALTRAIEELTRPIDAIKHQAKTVTVGISRSDEELLHVPLVRAVLAAGATRDALTYRSLRTLVALDPTVVEVIGSTRYRIEGDLDAETATIHVVDSTVDFPSRTDDRSDACGARSTASRPNAKSRSHGAGATGGPSCSCPRSRATRQSGLTLLHVRFADRLPGDVMRTILSGYQGRYGALKDAVTETVPEFADDVLASIDVVELLTAPVYVLADRWPRA